ncbi:SDR family oxidoreductase [Nocardia sp. NPDC052254]|uniref:SDR family oxidoreductase n=1 Tax=Nocardia sp. NPDC052254 TaxID=3155681 RepID=UPI00343F2507
MQTFVVTGSASGIGAATKARLESDGHRVLGIDLNNADITADLGTLSGRQAAVAAVGDRVDGSIDGFVAAAGVSSAPGMTPHRMLAINYFGAVELLEGLRPLLAAAPLPAAVLFSSNSTTCQSNWHTEVAEACLAGDEEAAGALADANETPRGTQTYPASKAALAYYARTRSAEYISDGIRLNAVAPGVIDTPMSRAASADPVTAAATEKYIAAIPSARAGTADEVASAVTFLLGPDSTYVIGSVLFVDGGSDAAARGMDWPARKV